jgi:hypothetical protein
LALSVKREAEIPLSMNETEIAQAGSIAFSISSRGGESPRHALNDSALPDREVQMYCAGPSRNDFRRRDRNACSELDQGRGRRVHDNEGTIAREYSPAIRCGQPMVLVVPPDARDLRNSLRSRDFLSTIQVLWR